MVTTVSERVKSTWKHGVLWYSCHLQF